MPETENTVDFFDFNNTDDLAPEVAALVEVNIQDNPKRDDFLKLLGTAPRALTSKELFVAGTRAGLVEDKLDENGEAVVEDGVVVRLPAVSTVSNWVRTPAYGAVQTKRGYYAVKNSAADNGERYEHTVKSQASEDAPEAAEPDIDDLGDLD